jgi:8-oxo-dGTP pyrophosphatase MutT (NUDIX family)
MIQLQTRIYASVIVHASDADKYLLIKRSSDSKSAPGEWEFVNGAIDEGETVEQTAVRELAEEVGLEVPMMSLKPMPLYELSDHDGRWVVIPYHLTLKDYSPTINISHEHSDYKWMSLEQIAAIDYLRVEYEALVSFRKDNE